MYDFIVNLFTDQDYEALLEDGGDGRKNKQKQQMLLIPLDGREPVITTRDNIREVVNANFAEYPIDYFNVGKFINPTHKASNNIGGNTGLMSHSITHYKITDTFILKEGKKPKKYTNGNIILQISQEKINLFQKSAQQEEHYKQFYSILDKICAFLREFERYNPENKFGLGKYDVLIFLVGNEVLENYVNAVQAYVNEKILKYPSYESDCDICGTRDTLYTMSQGNIFDLAKGRKFLLRKPTRYGCDSRADTPKDYNLCPKCIMKIYNFFEYITNYKYYRFVFPVCVKIMPDDYQDYSPDARGILKKLRDIYEKCNRNPFDYVMMTCTPTIEDIEFKYISNFDFRLSSAEKPQPIMNFQVYTLLKDLPQKKEDVGISKLSNERDKLNLLMDLNLFFNNLLISSLFIRSSKDLIKTLPTFLKQKIIEYNSIIASFIYFENRSFFDDGLFTKMVREILSECVTNKKYRDELMISQNKIRYFVCIYYKYLHLEKGGVKTVSEYMHMKEKLERMKKDGAEHLRLENDFEASYCVGQLFYYLLQKSKVQNRMEQFTKYTLNVSNMEVLKKRLVTVLEKYSHNEYIDSNKYFHALMKEVLSYKFTKPYEDNKIAMYTGYFDKCVLYMKKEEELEESEENVEE